MNRPPASTTVTAAPGSIRPAEAMSPLKTHGWLRARASRPRFSRRTGFTALLLAQHDNHQQRVPAPLEHLMRLEAEEPLDELEAPGEGDERLDLLREEHPREMALAVHPAPAVLDALQDHRLA